VLCCAAVLFSTAPLPPPSCAARRCHVVASGRVGAAPVPLAPRTPPQQADRPTPSRPRPWCPHRSRAGPISPNRRGVRRAGPPPSDKDKECDTSLKNSKSSIQLLQVVLARALTARTRVFASKHAQRRHPPQSPRGSGRKARLERAETRAETGPPGAAARLDRFDFAARSIHILSFTMHCSSHQSERHVPL
jgi:hypothetical protein